MGIEVTSQRLNIWNILQRTANYNWPGLILWWSTCGKCWSKITIHTWKIQEEAHWHSWLLHPPQALFWGCWLINVPTCCWRARSMRMIYDSTTRQNKPVWKESLCMAADVLKGKINNMTNVWEDHCCATSDTDLRNASLHVVIFTHACTELSSHQREHTGVHMCVSVHVCVSPGGFRGLLASLPALGRNRN